MTALVDDVIRNSHPLGNEKLSLYLRGGAGDVFLYSLVGQRFGSALLEPMSERSDLLCRGWALTNVPDPGNGVNTSPCVAIAGRASGFDNSAGADEITENHIGRLVYAVDDNTLALTNGDTGGGPTRSPAGYFQGFETMAGVTTLVIEVPDPFEEAVSILQGVGGGDEVAGQDSLTRAARGVVLANQANLAAFTVASSDGITYVEDDIVLLVAQTTESQDGPYVVGTVAGGTAPLTRPTWWAAASVQPAGVQFLINAGTVFGGSVWYATLAGDITVGTSAPDFFPRVHKGTTAALAGTPGTITTTGLWIRSSAEVVYSRKTTGGTPGHLSIAVTAGEGDGQVVFTSTANETSTIAYAIHN